jgi:hypothetical protein
MLKEIKAKGLQRYPDAVAEGLIEPGIKPLTDALYASGAYPLASCEGHPIRLARSRLDWLLPGFKRTQLSSNPYVMFGASETYARRLQCECDRQRSRLFHTWWVRAHFVPGGDYQLAWTIELNDMRAVNLTIDLGEAHQDIRQLALMARQVANLGAPDTDHPHKEL